MRDVETVGGKNASLGEMIGSLARLGVQVPGGFATTAHAYREFLEQGGLAARIRGELAALDVDDVTRLAASGARIRQWILATPLPPALTAAVSAQLQGMSAGGAGAICILQARPETVQSRAGRTIQRYALKGRSRVLATGRSIGQRIGAGAARVIRDAGEMARVQSGEVLVADMTD